MASTTPSPGPIPVYGQVTLDGQQYIERPQIFVADIEIDQPFEVLTGLRLTVPGVADFLLKGIGRYISPPPTALQPSTFDALFRFRLVNAEGTTWYFTGGLGIFDDRVVSTLCFGSGQFPFPLIPPIPIHASGSLIYEIEDLAIRGTDPYPELFPYTIRLAFYGAYLIPATGGGTGAGPLAFSGG